MIASRRRPKSRRNRWLTPVFAVVLCGLAAAGWGLAREAQDAVLESQSGSISSVNLDPDAPGFRAFTEPTPTALVLHTTVTEEGGAALVGATFLAAADEGRGGTVLSIPSTLVDSSESPQPLDAQFEEEGFAEVVASMKELLGIGFGDVVVLDAGAWVTLMAPDLPLTMTLRTDLTEEVSDTEFRTLISARTGEFTPAEVAVVAAHTNPGEPAINSARRQQEIWRAWISRTAVADDRPDLFGVNVGFIDLVADLANGEVGYQTVPILSTTAVDGDTLYRVDDVAVTEIVAQVVTFPIPPEPGGRASVMLLDGTGGGADERSILRDIVASGGQVSIVGNADSAAVAVSEVQVHDAELAEVARAIANRLGTGPPISVPLTEATVAITVVVGADLAPAA